jgi:hypothetical protein
MPCLEICCNLVLLLVRYVRFYSPRPRLRARMYTPEGPEAFLHILDSDHSL